MKALTLAVLLATAACAPAIQSRGLQSIVTERLYFGRNVAQTLGVTDSAWAVFVTDVVSAQLQNGFTFWAATGEWRGGGGRAAPGARFVLEVVHPARAAATETAGGGGLPPDKHRVRQEKMLPGGSYYRAGYQH